MRVRLLVLAGCVTLGVVGCGDDGKGGVDSVATEESLPPASLNIDPNAPPGEMCPTGEWPIVAAHALDSGRLIWVACNPDPGMFIAEVASEDTVWVLELDVAEVPIAFDARTGAELGRGTEADFPHGVPDDADWHMRYSPAVDGVYVTAGQDDPLRGVDHATQTQLWENVGFLAYDDVWAIGDGAVFAMKWDTSGQQRGGWVVGYNIADGTVRWEVDALAEPTGWPWHVADGRVYLLWYNVQVLSTTDGSTIWETKYPQPEGGFPRMFGVVANDKMVFVSFTAIPSGGD